MTWSDWDKALLALVMWREACGEGKEGLQAVGCVIRNRVNDTGDWAKVITARLQFSSMTSPGDSMLIRWPVNDPVFVDAMNIAEDIYNDRLPDNTNGATHYRNPVTATSESFQKAVDSGQLKQTVQIGHHVFYK